jgi:hypothetical protein
VIPSGLELLDISLDPMCFLEGDETPKANKRNRVAGERQSYFPYLTLQFVM